MDYNDKLKLAKEALDSGSYDKETIEYIFPELKEGEDEKIRQFLIREIEGTSDKIMSYRNMNKKDVLIWLEKQGEQKPVECSEDNLPDFESYLCLMFQKFRTKGICTNGEIIDFVKEHSQKLKNTLCSAWSEKDEELCEYLIKNIELSDPLPTSIYSDCKKWLKSLKYRVQPKQEWSEEDEEMYKEVLTDIIYAKNDLKVKECLGLSKRAMKAFNWFSKRYKSLKPQNWTKKDKERYISCLQRLGTGNPEQPETINSKWFKEHVYPQSTWKPSDEQMTYIQDAISKYNEFSNEYMDLVKLYNDLKKLREE